nr:glycosyltransferase family 2 protein [Caldicoprobacter algeriensis]
MVSKIFGVIVTYKPDVVILEKCIHSLKNQLDKVIIVDNTHGGCEKLESFKTFPNLEVIYLKDNYGIAYAQNVGIKKALENNADYILLSDQDTVYPPDFVEKMLECFKEEEIAACGPLFIDANTGRKQFFIKKGLFGFKRFYPTSGKHEVLQLIASGTILNSRYLSYIGLMKEDLFIDWVDMEWCWRAVKKGYKIIGNADVKILHKHGEKSIRFFSKNVTLKSPLRHYYTIRNGTYLALRNSNLDIPHRVILFLKTFRNIFLFALLSKPHLIHLKYTVLGFWHGITGKSGELNEAH